MKNKDFDFEELPFEAQDESIDAADFVLVENAERAHEQKFLTKPTTFFKDSVKRFTKNKSSVVATFILGTLLLMSVFVPIIDRNDIVKIQEFQGFLQPKLFNSGFGFWDGTKKCEKVAVDVNGHGDATTEEEKQEFWWPMPEDFAERAVSNKTFSEVVTTSSPNKYANGGYVQFGISKTTDVDFATLSTSTFANVDINGGDIVLKTLDVYNAEKLQLVEKQEDAVMPNNYVQGKAALYFNYTYDSVDKSIKLADYAEKFDISNLNLTNIIKSDADVVANGITNFKDASFSLKIEKNKADANECVLIKKIEFDTSNPIKNNLEKFNFDDANEMILRSYESETNNGFWICDDGIKKLYDAKVIYCDFVYDSYEAVFGTYTMGPDQIFISDIENYMSNGWCDFTYDIDYNESLNKFVVMDGWSFEVLNEEKCPVKEITNVTALSNGTGVQITAEVVGYRYYGYDSMPRFLMGTDRSGRDMFKYVFDGLKTSLLLGVISFIICFLIGLIWGAISGYFGGLTDLIMERITDILNGLPWIVVMTLFILHFGPTLFVFGLAICFTGWIGTAATTRTQFYRFRGREYVLASRSLGASDARLIAKHILPNAMGTIITSSVLMIPSVIFSEATISYLGLGLQGQSSLGVILSNNQSQLTVHPYLLIFPAVIIALLMISFNLFGNGLRDAVNPSLKGED